MAIRRTQNSIVIVAHSFNPSVFTESWLVGHGVFISSELQGKLIYTPKFVTVNGPIGMFAVDERLQVSSDASGIADDISARMRKMVEQLPHVPYAAVGMNFVSEYEPTDVADFSSKHLIPPSAHLFGPSSEFGTIAVSDSHGGRRKVTVSPEGTKITFHLNYHFDLSPPNAHGDLLALIDQWGSVQKDAEDLVAALCS